MQDIQIRLRLRAILQFVLFFFYQDSYDLQAFNIFCASILIGTVIYIYYTYFDI